ncbi:MAG: ARMT1-like domain-containing protein [Planctomycetota bacterium]
MNRVGSEATDVGQTYGQTGPALPTDSLALARRAQRVTFPRLADPSGYRPGLTNLTRDAEARGYWLGMFRSHAGGMCRGWMAEAAERGISEEKANAQRAEAQAEFGAYLDRVQADPAAFGQLDILSLCWAREDALERAGIVDAYAIPKRQENERALPLLPALLAELDAMPEAERFAAAWRGVLAGNIFDLGAKETIAMFESGQIDFEAVRAKLKPRPWRFDDFEALAERFDAKRHPAYRCACLFVDNAGPDVLLGMLPLARELLRRGTGVILTANTRPSLNDVTHDELVALLDRVTEHDAPLREALADGRLECVPSGNDAPLIDLLAVSPELADAVTRRGVDLVVLEGMGRSVESNFHAGLTCDAVKVCMVKDAGVARELDAEVFDLVLKFEPAGA